MKRAEEEGLLSLKCKPGRGVKSFLSDKQIFDFGQYYRNQYQQKMDFLAVGKQKMLFNLSERNLVFLIPNQE